MKKPKAVFRELSELYEMNRRIQKFKTKDEAPKSLLNTRVKEADSKNKTSR